MQPDKISALSRTAPPGMFFPIFLKAMLALDIDLYEVCSLLGLDEEVQELMRTEPEHYPNARRGFAQQEIDPLTSFIRTLPAEKQDKVRSLIEKIVRNA